MNNDIRLSVSFKGHRKRRKLEMLLGPSAVLCLIDLWISTAQNHPKGNLSGLDDIDISLEAGWQGNPGDFVNALISCGFLDGESGFYALHDWMDHQSYVVHAPERSAQARKAAEAKWSKMRGACSKHADSMRGAMLNTQNSNAPSPDPIPSPDPLPDPPPAPSQQKKTPLSGKPDDCPLFDEFWTSYPRKEDKKKAKVAFCRLSVEKKRKAVDDCAIRYVGTEKQYIPLPTTYIHGERWDDEIKAAPSHKKSPKPDNFDGKDYGEGGLL